MPDIEPVLDPDVEPDADVDAVDADVDDADPEGADQLGDAGKRALESMKAKLKAEKAARIAAEKRAWIR